MEEHVWLEPGDVVLVSSDGLVAWGIRRFRSKRGEPTYVNHAAMVVERGTLATAVLMDAQPPEICQRRLGEYAGQLVAVFRPRPSYIPSSVLGEVVAQCREYEGTQYGYLKIALHLMGLSGLAYVDRWPICSWTVAVPVQRAGYSFGVDSGVAKPDHIWDFCRSRPEYWQMVRELSPLWV